ncbi:MULTISPECIES: type VII toxin-antitoxin system MntA family adenylyltransferase antitoxin [Caloramator]|uniref:DNA polymerase, beta domain protein region n=1 Tax=Caloramator australicus RC3 TaxID=857293 RepID=I7KTN1_9CLOT|nr:MULTISPECIES: nucleotidyltransferase domain-containing protein [Caloramator]WDU82470.1 nucleotidyltransferase domain-containing protein [Caloramator sp. Dgby_cultured_2]CCJ33173.1 DNA polymerase, beta domain protein region [Caloramator australicus RC3]
MISIEDKIPALVNYFNEDKRVIAVYIIGSYGTEYQREDSDIDFAVLFEDDIDFIEETKIACKITEILKFDNVDIVNLNKAPLTLQVKAINEGREIYVADSIKLSDFIELVYKKYRDAKYFIDSFNRDFFSNFKNRGVNG